MRSRTLTWHIFVPFLAIIVLALALITAYSSRALREMFHERTAVDLADRARLLHDQVAALLIAGDAAAIQAYCEQAGAAAHMRLTVVAPEYVFAPVRVRIAAPCLSSVPVPETMLLKLWSLLRLKITAPLLSTFWPVKRLPVVVLLPICRLAPGEIATALVPVLMPRPPAPWKTKLPPVTAVTPEPVLSVTVPKPELIAVTR